MCYAINIRGKTKEKKVIMLLTEKYVRGSQHYYPGRGGDSHMKGAAMLVVSLRDVNFGSWSHLGCSGENAIIFSPQGLV